MKDKVYKIKMMERGAGRENYLYRKYGGKIIYNVNTGFFSFVDTNCRPLDNKDYSPEYVRYKITNMFREIAGVYPYYKVEQLTFYAIFHFYTMSGEIFRAKCSYNVLFEYRDRVKEFLHYYIW